MTERIRWTWQECEMLYMACALVVEQHPDQPIYHIVEMEQRKALPENRQRHIATIGMVPLDLRNRLQALREGKTSPVDAEKLVQEVTVLRADLEAAIKNVARLEHDNSQLRNVPKPPSPVEVVQDFLAGIIGKAIQKSREVPGGPHLTPHPAVSPKHNGESATSEVPRPPKILVCGLKSDQREYYERYFKDRVRFRWWWDDNYKKLDDMARNAAMVYVMMGAVSHDTVAKVVAATDNYQRVANYSREHLRDLIEAWLRRYHVELVGIPQLGGAV